MATCACCNCELPATSVVDELCPACTRAMESGEDSSPDAGFYDPDFHDQWVALHPELPPQPTDAPVRPRAPGTRALVLINVAIYIVCVILNSFDLDKAIDLGVEWGPATLGGQWWRMLTSTFLHAGTGHLLGNMWWLWVVGKMTEQIFSTRTFLVLYFLTGLAGDVASLSMHPEIHSVGASGAIFGITGVAIAAFWLGRLPSSPLRLSGRIWPLMIFTGLSLYGGATNPRIDNAAHIGGFVSGLLLGILLSVRFDGADMERIRRLEHRMFAAMSVLLVLGAISLRLYYRDILPLAAADQAMENGRLEEAARIAESVTEKRPADAEAQLFLGRVYLRERDYVRAKEAINRSLKLDYDNNEAWFLWREAHAEAMKASRRNDQKEVH
jgi:membrane associated rhomboid family serine protease